MSQTPDGSFYDLMTNAAELLTRCGMDVPEVGRLFLAPVELQYPGTVLYQVSPTDRSLDGFGRSGSC